MKITFVILHYLTDKDTRECIDSITNSTNYNEYNIVVVDNGSYNGTGELLQKEYNTNPKVHFIHSKINLGFAKGNNLGYTFAKKELKTDFIIMINNDTIINQIDFVDKMIDKYNKHKFDILGPDIISMIDNGHQNPYCVSGRIPTKKQLRINILKNNIFLVLSCIGMDNIIRQLYRKLIKRSTTKNTINTNYGKDLHGVMLHGSCLIFSPGYINRFKGLYDGTFLYKEEDILYYIAKKEKLKILYTPDIKLLHKEDSSTNALFSSNIKKRRFIYINQKKSAKEFQKILDDDLVYKKNIEV